MPTFTELRTRLREALGSNDQRYPNTTLDDWLVRSITNVVDLCESDNHTLWNELRDLNGVIETTLDANAQCLIPDDILKIRTKGHVNGCKIAKIVRPSEQTLINEHNHGTTLEPYLHIIETATGAKIDTQPHAFHDKRLFVWYVKNPTVPSDAAKDTSYYGPRVADAIVYGAALLGFALDHYSDHIAMWTPRYNEALARLGLRSGQ
jgi:hypothetical protein